MDRLLESVAALDYPQDKLEIQILDDSTDDTTEQCYRKVEELKARGFDAVCIHRTDRTGFKAGALEAATKVAKGEFPADSGRRLRSGTGPSAKNHPFLHG